MASVTKQPSPYVRWGRRGLQVRKEVADRLNLIRQWDDEVFEVLWDCMTQGKSSHPGDKKGPSNGTHDDGWAVDFVFRHSPKWNLAFARRVQKVLQGYFACGWRHAGEVEPGNPAHLHVAAIPHSNSAAILRAAPVGSEELTRRMARCFPQESLV